MPDYVCHASFGKCRPLKLPLSCEVVEEKWFLGPNFVGGEIPQISDMHFQIHSLPSIWPVVVEFRSASAETGWRKRRRRRRIRGKT